MKSRDSSQAIIFGDGDHGPAHVAAHRALDAGDPVTGHRELGRFLEDRGGRGPRWVHLQWHMLIFELQLDRWQDARRRFDLHILPAVARGEAPVDAPAALWWLRLSAADGADLPWEPVRRRALAALETTDDAHTLLHHLLALAGAGDVEALDRWLGQRPDRVAGPAAPTLIGATRALRAIAAGQCEVARSELDRWLPELPRLGGSRAQNELFPALSRAAAECAANGSKVTLPRAA